jgi:hypothetical protein
MRAIRIWSIGLLLAISGCVPAPGSFCSIYQPLALGRDAAIALVLADRSAAEAAVVNEETYGECK